MKVIKILDNQTLHKSCNLIISVYQLRKKKAKTVALSHVQSLLVR